MSESKLIDELNSVGYDYLCKGQHYIKTVSKNELELNVVLTIDENEAADEKFCNLTNHLWNRIKTKSEKIVNANFIFTGNIGNISEMEQKKWFLNCLSSNRNKFTTYFFNKKLEILTSIIDSFLTVFNTEFVNVVRCNLQYHLFLSPDISSSNVKCELIWIDHNLASKSSHSLSAYKIFYILAVASENVVINSSTSHLVERRFINETLLTSAKFKISSISMLLKQINFTDSEVKQIFEILIGLIELSQYRAQGDGKKLEFIGSGHLKKAAECFLVKEKQLRDFVIVEYIWQDNKRKLKNPEIVNSEIDSFISAIYNVILQCILDKFNSFVEINPKTDEFIDLKFLHSPPLPAFDKEKIFTYGDYYRYYISNTIQSIAADKIEEKIKKFINSGFLNNSKIKITEPKKSLDPKISFSTVMNFITEYKNAKNPTEYIQKLEKSNIKEIKFCKISHQIFIDIYIPEFVSFIRFNWQSFVEDSSFYCWKQLNNFMKLTSNSVINNYKVKQMIGRIWTSDDISNLVSTKNAYSKNEFFIHLLLEEKNQNIFKYPFRNQIINNNLQYFHLKPFWNDIIHLNEFVNKYRVLFLAFNDNSRTDVEATQHAIFRLQLTDAWCCSDYIHLPSSQINDIESLIRNYHKYVVTIQGYSKIIIARIKLKHLRKLSDQYKEEYLDAASTLVKISNLFTTEYLPILNVDKENIDLKTFSSLIPECISLKRGDHDNALWLNVTFMNKMSILHKQIFSSSKICLFYSNEEITAPDNCIDIGKFLSQEMKSEIHNHFILKISNERNGDVLMDIKTKTPLFVWNINTDINKMKRKKYPASRGYMLSMNQYRIFQEEFIIKKLAYDSINKIVYESFDELVEHCSVAIILQPDPLHKEILTKSPLWMSITNCLPYINLESTSTFNLVEKERRIIDKTECSKYVNLPYLRPKNDWIFENVSTQLLKRQSMSTSCDCTDNAYDERLSNAKFNYKTTKYLMKK